MIVMQDTLVQIDTLAIDELNSKAWALNRKDAYKAIELSTEALTKSKEIDYKRGIAHALKTLGTSQVWISKNEEALTTLFEAISIFNELGDKKNEAETYYYVGANFRYLSDYDSAIKYYNECYSINNQIGDEMGMADGLNGLGTVYYSIEKNDKSLEVLLESQKLCLKHNDKEIYVKVLDGLGETYHNLKQYDLALEHYNKCASICATTGNKQVAAFALDGLGRTYSATKKYREALDKFNESLNLRRELGFKAGEIITLYNIGVLYIEKGDVVEGVKFLEQSFELSQKIHSKEGVYKASEKLAEAFEKAGKLDLAIKYYKIFQSTREEVRNEKTNQLVKSVEMQHKMLQSQAEKFLLEEKAKELESYSNNLVLISEIGQQIISQHTVAEIVETVYDSVNNLMDAAGFGIGLFDAKKQQVIFPLYIEGDEKFKDLTYDVKDTEKLTVNCFVNKREIVINDFSKEYHLYFKNYVAPSFGKAVNSIIYLPLNVRGNTVGVITVQSFNANAYKQYHLNILRNLASYSAIALDNAQIYELQEKTIFARTREVISQKEEIEKAYQNNKLLSEVGREITSTLNFEEIFDKLYSYVNRLMDATVFGIDIYHPDKNLVEYKFSIEKGVKCNTVDTVSMDNDNNFSVWCIKNKKEIFINDNIKEHTKYVKQINVISGDLTHSLIFYPIMYGEKVLGAITIQSFERNAYKEHHLDTLRTLASYIAIAFENASLYENLEEKVKERTLEVVKQKEEIEKNNDNTKLLSQIGREITSTFSTEEIISKVYKHINQLMDAAAFGIGIYDEPSKQLVFKGVIEKGVKLSDFSYSINSTDRPAVWCYSTQQDYKINNFNDEFVKSKKVTDYQAKAGENPECIMYVPITQKDKRIGVVTVQSFERDAYSDYHLQLLKSLAVYMAIALDNAALYEQQEKVIADRTKEVVVQKEEIEKAYQTSKLLSEIGQQITSTLNFEEIFDKLHYYVNQLMNADCFGIRLYHPEKNVVEYKYGIERGEKYHSVASVSMDDDDNYSVWCIKNKKEIFLNDNLNEYKKYVKQIKVVSGDMPHSLIFYPIMMQERVLGVVTIQSFEKFAYKEHHLDVLKTLASYIAIALENASLYENMEDKVKERTLEVVKQKEEIEKTYENTRLLGQIGKDITSTLSVDEVIEKVYSNVNSLMDASVFAIGLFNEAQQRLVFSGTMERGKKLDDFSYTLTDDTLGVWCYNNEKEVLINDYPAEHTKYIKQDYIAAVGDDTLSMIFLPIYGKDKKLGVLSVQSFKTHSYSDYHLNILQNLAVHIGIALDNASLYENMEERVEERTKEIEKNYNDTKLLSEIAEDISSSLSVETIIAKVYSNVNKLLKADCFGIGMFNPLNGFLEFKGFVENNQLMDDFGYPANDPNRLAAISFTNKREIFINNYALEYGNYIKGIQAPVSGKDSASIIYLPIYSKEIVIGVLTVQSFEINVYTNYHLNILKSLAISIGIALDNAALYENLEEKVKERTTEVFEQKAIIEEKNKDITDSIRYAKKIQLALMPDTDLLKTAFAESFVYYRPKDIVSGDFYWIELFKNNVTVFAAADCTGHGVPGAFMSLICNDLMNQVIKDQNVTTPAHALTVLDERLRAMLNKSSDHSSNDGMDIALCAYHPNQMIMQFAGAHRPLLLIRDGELIEYKPSKHSIGGYLTGNKVFNDNVIQLKKGDQVYVLTDGYADQFGGENGKKFKFKKLQKLIQTIAHMPMKDQHDLLEEAFVSWRGKHEQVDDVCVIGLKI
ncbi:MAG: GAF domain-containing protein [Bacteroidetes bacterium]|nr:GAF domain-containing protein [Bacteroidota bacterium]